MPTFVRILLVAGLWLGVSRAAFAEDADAFYKQGLAYKAQGKADQAIDAFEHAVAANPRHYQAWASLGNLYKTAKQDIPRSVTAYEHAVEGLKKDKVVWENLGMAYYRNNQSEQALKALVTASTLDPNDAEIRFNLGTVRRQTKDYAGAVADLEVAAKLKPQNATFHLDLAILYRRQTAKNPDVIPQAIAEYEEATRLDPNDADAWMDLGLMYKEDHQNDKAVAAFQKFIDRNKGKDKGGQKRAEDEIGALNTSAAKDDKARPADKPTPKKPPPKK